MRTRARARPKVGWCEHAFLGAGVMEVYEALVGPVKLCAKCSKLMHTDHPQP